ncbi:neuromodulin-like [Bufo bufo]|uniref:neuromodulin-like n=1 Tax=Bufo bufo TaxID=8384 RepID=UPI001ABE37CE|nr:neuromodulin-like [Bufo bufo]
MLVSFILQRMVKKGYDRTRRHDSKKEIVRSIQQMLREKFAREHSESAIVKRWSDLKRRDPEFVREISERVCPGQPVPTVRSTPAHRDIHVVEVSEEEEEEAGPPTAMETSDTAPPDVAEHVEVEVEEEGGPSQPHTSPAAAIPPAEVTEEEEEQEVAAQSEEEEELVTTPQQEVVSPKRQVHGGVELALCCERSWRFKKIQLLKSPINTSQNHTSNQSFRIKPFLKQFEEKRNA